MRLHRLDIPVAISFLQLARKTVQPFQEFICYWTAFNNIYAVIADMKGVRPTLQLGANNQVRTGAANGVRIARVKVPTEKEQIGLAFDQFEDELKHSLIMHKAASFFVYRTPQWRGQDLKEDALGQRINGVLKVGRTVNAKYPSWSPIDTALYEKYMSGIQPAEARNALSKQILDVLYTVRNNLVHGSKAVDDANNRDVIENALPLLRMIVQSFLPHPRRLARKPRRA